MIKQVSPELFVGNHLEQVRVGRTDHPDIGIFGFKDMEQHRLFVESQQRQVLQDDCSAVGVFEVALNPVVGFAAVGLGVMLSDVRCAPASITMMGF